MNNAPPYKITSKILKFSTQISEELAKLKFIDIQKADLMLRKKNRIKIFGLFLWLKNCDEYMLLKSCSNIKKDVPINDPRNVPTKRLDDIICIMGKHKNITIAQLSPYNIKILG